MSGGTGNGGQVLRPDELPSVDRGGGASTVALVTAARGATSYLNGTTIFDPSARIAHHQHNVAESVMVVEGEAIIDIDGVRSRLRTFDTTFVPANIPHHFENASEDTRMRIFWTYGSLDATRTVVDSDTTTRIDGETPAAADGCSRPVHEVAILEVIPGHEAEFEDAVRKAVPLFQKAHGARTLTLDVSAERPNAYRLVIGWDTIHDHVVAFRDSTAFAAWRVLVNDHLQSAPQVEHLTNVLTGF